MTAFYDFAAADPATLHAMGFSRQKVSALIALAVDTAAGRLSTESLESMTDEVALSRLQEGRGVGRWTAEYALLRGLGRLHVFPGDDVGCRKNLRRWLGQAEPSDYEEALRVLAPWYPYAGLIYYHLLLDGLADAGYLS